MISCTRGVASPAPSAFGHPPGSKLVQGSWGGRAAIGNDHCSADAACSALKRSARRRTQPRRRRPPTCRPPTANAATVDAACRDLIKQVRQCKTAAEERNVIAKESAALRQAFKEQDGTYRHRCGGGAGGRWFAHGHEEAVATRSILSLVLAPAHTHWAGMWPSSCSCTCWATPRTLARWRR